jgi:hypothetical protein
MLLGFGGLNGFFVIVASSRRGSQRRSSGLISIACHRRFTQRLVFGKLPLQPLAGRRWFRHSDGRRNLSACCHPVFCLQAFSLQMLPYYIHRAMPCAIVDRLSACFAGERFSGSLAP